MKSKKLALFIVPFLFIGSLVGCGNQASVPTVDYVHNGDVTLELDYHNTDFYTQGVVEVSLAPKGCIDGDTVHFYPKTGTKQGRLKARFYGVDTPESTGSIEPWGFAASNFTKSKIMAASENGTIVVSSPADHYAPPSPDSTGSRYVLMVWINETKKNAPLNELYSLNLWLVQEGLSWAKSLDDMPQYKATFQAAEDQARNLKRYIFSDLDDPDYNYGDYLDLSFLDIAHEIQEGLKDKDYEYTFNNAKVHLAGTVGGISNGTLYLQNFYSEAEGSLKEEGEYVGINVFTGMGGIPTRFKQPNSYIEIYGVAKNSQFGFQIVDCYFPLSKKDDSERSAKVLLYPEENTISAETYDEEGKKLGHKLKVFEMTANELSEAINQQDYSYLFSPITITDAVRVDTSEAYLSDKNYASLPIANQSFAVYCAFIYKVDPYNEDDFETWTKLEDFENKNFRIQNCVLGYHEDNKDNLSIQFCPSSAKNFIWEEKIPTE